MPRAAWRVGWSAAIAALVIAVGLGAAPGASASATPFTCTGSPQFVSSGSPTQLYEVTYGAGGASTFTAVGGATSLTYNAIGFDTVNNFLYGSTASLSGSQELVQIDSNGTQTLLSQDVLPGGFLAGAFDSSGDYLATNDGASGQQEIYELNVASGSATTVPMMLNGSQFTSRLVDWTYDDNYLWSFDSSTGDIVRIDPATGDVTEIPQSYVPGGTYGSAWTLGNGDIALRNGTSGESYVLAISNPSSASPTVSGVSTASGLSTSNDDGAACADSVDLAIQAAGPSSVAVSSPVTYTLTVTNDSSADTSSGFIVSDPVPAGFTNLATTTPGCSVSSNVVTCQEGQLAPAGTFQATIAATSPASGGAYTNTATVSGNEADPDASNNSSSVTTDVGFANVSLTNSATTTSPHVGAQDTFTLTASNAANSTADSGQLVVTDTLPAGLTYVSSSMSNCANHSCVSVSGQTVTWTIANLTAGATATGHITVDVDTSSSVGDTATFTQGFPNSTGATSGMSNTVTLTPSASINSLAASGTAVSASEGQQFSGQIATFSDADNQPPSAYSATITWGDGQSSAGTVSQTGTGAYAVSGTNTYADEGSYPVSVQITDIDGTSAQASSTATVADAALTAGLIKASCGANPCAVTLAFADANPGATIADFTATINWGDTTSSAGTVLASGGGFVVTGSHAYADDGGGHAITITVTDDGGSTVSATAPAATAMLLAKKSNGDDKANGSFFMVVATCSSGTATALLNGVPVKNGDVVRLKLTKRGDQKVMTQDGRLSISATSFLLVVTCTDAAGNQGCAITAPVFKTRNQGESADEFRHTHEAESDH